MKYLIAASAVFCVLGMSSCREKPATRPTVANPQFTLPTGNGATPANPVLPGTSAASSTGALNPAHGQPGHRCDIAVGAPLPVSSPVNNPSALTASNPAVQPVSVPPAAAAKPAATGVNPAHGQPGHRCDIAVGAPLNSKPATTSTTTPTTTNTASKPTPLQPDTLFAKGLNPAHGQPGHRCDIAVGQPLNSAKKTETLAPAPVSIEGAGN